MSQQSENLCQTPKDPVWQPGFTLTEMLVVIAIVAVLIGVLLPFLARARTSAEKARTQADFNAITMALEAYKQDFGDYPRVQAPDTSDYVEDAFGFDLPDGHSKPWASAPNPQVSYGAEALCWALIGPYDADSITYRLDELTTGNFPGLTGATDAFAAIRDGADGPGFRPTTRTRHPGPDGVMGNADDTFTVRGQVYGPYLDPEKFSFGIAPESPRRYVLLDVNESAILYFPANPSRPSIHQANGYVARSKASMFDLRDGEPAFIHQQSDFGDPNLPMARMRTMLGDADADGQIDPGESAPELGPFLLWSGGPDDRYGAADPANSQSIRDCDDMINVSK